MIEHAFEQLEDRVRDLESQVAELRSLVEPGVDGGEQPFQGVGPGGEDDAQPPAQLGAERHDAVSIEQWFASAGFEVKFEQEEPKDRVYDKLAEFLGDHYAELKAFVGGLRWTLHEDKKSRRALRKVGEPERRYVLEFAEMLNDLALLDEHNYNERTETLVYKAGATGQFRQFLSGLWLERYSLTSIKRKLEEDGRDFSQARNLHVSGSALNGEFELDVFFLVEGSPIWVECKSRDYRRDIAKYVERAQALSIPLERTILVVNEILSEQARDLSDMYGLHVTPTDSLADCVHAMLGGETSQGGLTELQGKFQVILANAQMLPHTDVRPVVLQALLNVTSGEMPATVRQIRERVEAALPEEMRAAVHPVLMAARRGGGLLDREGVPYRFVGLEGEIARLDGTDVRALEGFCQMGYRDAIDRKLPGVLDNPKAVSELDRLVMDTLPGEQASAA